MSGLLPVTHLDHVSLRVPDPEAAASFYRRALGLGETGRDGVSGAIRLSSLPRGAATVAHHEVIVSPGEPAGVDHVGLAVVDDAALVRAVALLRSRGLDIQGPQDFERMHGPAVRLRDPDGFAVELTVPLPPVPRPAGRVPFDLVKLAHINVKSPEPARASRWWQDIMDFRLSDQISETFYWLRCNCDHATVAIVRSTTPGVHHIAFEIASWDEIRRLGDHFVANDIRIEFGPGRHGPSHGLFVYFLDPWGIRWEVLGEPNRIEDESTYRPGRWDPVKGRPASANLWGPMPPDSFLRE
ncbi:MAG: VOC family protein [bacterium]